MTSLYKLIRGIEPRTFQSFGNNDKLLTSVAFLNSLMFHTQLKTSLTGFSDRNGNDITSAQVGDHLALRFEILDRQTSPYEIFVRGLVASDGIDASEILLVDAIGNVVVYYEIAF